MSVFDEKENELLDGIEVNAPNEENCNNLDYTEEEEPIENESEVQDDAESFFLIF